MEQAQQRFHELATRIAARGGRLRPDVGRATRVCVELNGKSPGTWVADELMPRVPGRQTLVGVEARRWAKGEMPTTDRASTSMAGEASGLVPREVDEMMAWRELPGASEVAQARAALQAGIREGGDVQPASMQLSPSAGIGDRLTTHRLPIGDFANPAAPERQRPVGERPSLGLGLEQYRVSALKELLKRIGPNHRLRHDFIAATASPIRSVVGAAQWGEPQPSIQVTNGHALWRVAERRAATLYRRAVNSGAVDQYDPAVEAAFQQHGIGQPLSMGLRHAMERELGVSLAEVRIHTDEVASRAAHALNAEAFTIGEDVFFAEGAFAPETRAGRKLLAHELTHVAQVLRGSTMTTGDGLRVSQPGDLLEREADTVADHFMGDMSGSDTLTQLSPNHSREWNPLEGNSLIGWSGAGLTKNPTHMSGLILRRASSQDGHKESQDRNEWSKIGTVAITIDEKRTLRFTVSKRKADPSRSGLQPETQIRVMPSMDNQFVGLDIEGCGENWLVEVTPQVNIPEFGEHLLKNELGHASPLADNPAQGKLKGRYIKSRSLSVESEIAAWGGLERSSQKDWGVGSHLSVTTPNFKLGVGGQYNHNRFNSLNINLILQLGAQRIPNVDCSKVRLSSVRPQFKISCQIVTPEELPVSGMPALPFLQSPLTTIYVLFDRGSTQIVGWRFEGIERTYMPNDEGIRTQVTELFLQGFLPRFVVGYASPEGLEKLPPSRWRGEFHGNKPLAESRATVAYNAFFYGLFRGCPFYGDRPIVPRGDSELYSPPPQHGHEIEGRELELHAVKRYVTEDPLRPTAPAEFGRQPHVQQVTQTYSFLRRAEIRLERNPIRIPAVPATTGHPSRLEDTSCPEGVAKTAIENLHLDLIPY